MNNERLTFDKLKGDTISCKLSRETEDAFTRTKHRIKTLIDFQQLILLKKSLKR